MTVETTITPTAPDLFVILCQCAGGPWDRNGAGTHAIAYGHDFAMRRASEHARAVIAAGGFCDPHLRRVPPAEYSRDSLLRAWCRVSY